MKKDNENVFEDYKKNKELKWGSKGYKHFDQPLGRKTSLKLVKSLTDPENVTNFIHYPLIVRYKKQLKFKNDEKKIKLRKLSLVSHKDSVLLKFCSQILNNYYEKYLKKCELTNEVVAYRKGKDNISTAKEVFDFIKQNSNEKKCYVIKGDFCSYFDNLNHKILKENLKKVLGCQEKLPNDWYSIFKFITKTPYVSYKAIQEFGKNKPSYFKNGKEFSKAMKSGKIRLQKAPRKGIPQGTSISGIFANIYAIEMDENLKKLVESYNGMYRRYSDDFIIVLSNMNKLKLDTVYKEVEDIVDISKQKLEREKTGKYQFYGDECIDLNKNLRSRLVYLGFSFDGRKVLLREGTMARFVYKSKRNIKIMYGNTLNHTKGNIPGRHKIVQRFLAVTKPQPKSNMLSYAERAQRKMQNFDNIKITYDVNVRKQVLKRIYKNQKYYGILKNGLND